MLSFFKKTLFLLLLTFNFQLSTVPVSASNEFETSLDTVYTVGNDGVTNVTQKVTLTNRFSNIYATQYALEVGSTRIKNIEAKTESGQVIPHSNTQTQNTTAITLNFNDKVVGKGQSHVFTISYQNLDVAIKNGNVLEANIPKISKDSGIENYTVKLVVPKSFKTPSVVTPKTYTMTEDGENQILTFTKSGIEDKAITAVFGDKQIFTFTLSYHLENPTVNKGVTQIALPPDTNYQKLYYDRLDPKPDHVDLDTDGNWLATYSLKPKERLDVVAQGTAFIYLNPTVKTPETAEDLSLYTKEQPYWQISDAKIQELAAKLQTPKAIYDYLVENFSYDYTRLDGAVTRMGAVEAINNPTSAICQEFTDAFIAIARAAGIPARELNGFAYTENSKLRPLSLVQDVLHAWPEYYDSEKKMWVQIDPTWGNTTGGVDYFNILDLNHFVFAIHGSSSDTPYAAGYYKYADVASKDILVEFGDTEPVIVPDFNFDLVQSPANILGFSAPSELTITNNTGVAYYQTDFAIESPNYTLDKENTLNVSAILPFSQQRLKFNLKPTSLFQFKPATLKISFLGQTQTYEQTNGSPNFNPRTVAFVAFALGAGFIALAIITRGVLVYRRGR